MKVIIFTGAPASGKSSLADAVGQTLKIKVISKDGYKIELFKKYGFTNHAEKKRLSIEGEKQMHECIRRHVCQNIDLIVDNNFKNFNELREILKESSTYVEVICIYCVADYSILARRYNERISDGKRHQALYTLNQYPVIEGISEFHPIITREDVERIQGGIHEFTFGNKVLKINTDKLEMEFNSICKNVIEYINSQEGVSE